MVHIEMIGKLDCSPINDRYFPFFFRGDVEF